jgi:hypothetical protein
VRVLTHGYGLAVAGKHVRPETCREILHEDPQAIKLDFGWRSIPQRYRVLAALVFLVVREDLPQLGEIVIDRDYAGAQAEATIRNLLLQQIRKVRPDATARLIRFAEVRGSRADKLAKQVFDGATEPDGVVSWAELAPLL